MSYPTLTPASQASKSILPVTGAYTDVTDALPFGIYSGSNDFISGAVDQVAYTYKKLGGDVLDIELKAGNVYAAYEEAVLEYSYIVNMHQAKNVLSNLLGQTTGSFDQHGQLKAGTLSSSLAGEGERSTAGNVATRFPRASFGYARRFADAASQEAGIGGLQTVYSASITIEDGIQDYDLQDLIVASGSQTDPKTEFFGKINNKKVLINRVYYVSPNAQWRFYGYYGGLNVLGNLSTYGQYADDSTFNIVPTWQNKSQAAAYEDAIRVRTSQYSYELRNNKLRIFPVPNENFDYVWVDFTVADDAWEEDEDAKGGTKGINNMNTLPFSNLDYSTINSIGKQWIRRFALSVTKEMLAQVRGKFTTIPIPGESVTLNATELASQAKEEQNMLRDELKQTLDQLTYNQLATQDAEAAQAAQSVMKEVPAGIFMG